MVKTYKNHLLWNQKADDLESWYAALGTQVLPNLFWDDLNLFYGKVKFWSLCHPYVCMCVNIFKHLFLRNHWANQKSKFHTEPRWDRKMKICSTGPGHMTKIATIPIYGKSLKKSSPEPKGWWPLSLVYSTECSSTTKFVQMMTLGWPWPILRRQIWSLMLLYGKKVKQWIFQKIVVYEVKVGRCS